MADENGIPIRFGSYEMIKTIGKGNFAVVKLARHTIINLQVAIKVISIKSLDSDQLRKLYREIDIMKQVGSHRNIVRLYQVMHSDRHVMLVTEYCAGGELFEQLVTKGRLSEKNARFYFHQIVDAVKYLHSNGIVHRDLKAENLLLTADFKCVKLADFGFSNYFTEQSFLATWCGSPPYAAPELFEGKQYNGPKADIWSLGVVLYVLVCGSLPFDGNTLQSLKTRVLSGKFRIPYFMSRDCEHLIRHMLVIDPDKRYSLQQIMQHKWLIPTGGDHESEKLSDKLENFHISNDAASQMTNSSPDDDDDPDTSLIEWIASELNVNSQAVMESIKSRSYDEFYALYCLVNDTSPNNNQTLSAPPSPPLLPIVPSTNQRKSSITTGIVEREPTPTSLAPIVSNVRRHTCPDAQAAEAGNAPGGPIPMTPALFLTPPTGMAPPMTNLPLAPPNYPLAMDLLKPPPVLLLANNNMVRRASDGQANYTRSRSHDQSTQTAAAPAQQQAPAGSVAQSGPSYFAPNAIKQSHPHHHAHQTSPPVSYVKRKRHSITDTNELISRQRRMQLAQANLNAERQSRRRASDGSTAGIYHHHPQLQQLHQHHPHHLLLYQKQTVSIPTLQNELRALCVSSPPSLHTSPIHTATVSMANQTHIGGGSQVSASAGSLPPSSPPPTLPQISEEQFAQNNAKPEAKVSPPKMVQQRYGGGGGSMVPLITPPQSFRSSPVTSPNNNMAPSISVTDELGTPQFPILPPPADFQQAQQQQHELTASHPNLELNPGGGVNSKMPAATDVIFNRLQRWRNDEKFDSTPPATNSNEMVSSPSYPNLKFEPDDDQPVDEPVFHHCNSLPAMVHHHHQQLHKLTTTDSGSICINDTTAAQKLLSRFGRRNDDDDDQILSLDAADLRISIQWNKVQKRLILKHISGDATQYRNLCRELISTII